MRIGSSRRRSWCSVVSGLLHKTTELHRELVFQFIESGVVHNDRLNFVVADAVLFGFRGVAFEAYLLVFDGGASHTPDLTSGSPDRFRLCAKSAVSNGHEIDSAGTYEVISCFAH